MPLLPGETRRLTFRLATADLKGNQPALDMAGWNRPHEGGWRRARALPHGRA